MTINNRLGWGLLPASDIAVELAKGVRASETGQLVAVASRDKERAEAFGQKHDVPTAYGDYRELIDDPAVDVVYVSTPHPLHAEWAIAAAEAGKHVLCEKPFALNHAEAMAMVDAAQRNGVFLMEAFMYRLHPQTERLVELLRCGAIGRLQLVEATFSFGKEFGEPPRLRNHDLGGGSILDIGCYCVSLARLAASTGRVTTEPTAVVGLAHIDPDDRIDDLALAALRFPGDVYAQVSCSILRTQEQAIRIYGDEGQLFISAPAWCSWYPEHVDGGRSTIELRRDGEVPELIEVNSHRPLYAYEVDHVAEHLAKRQSPVLTLADSLENMRTLDRWRESVGLAFDRELPEALVQPVWKRRLRRPGAAASIPRARLDSVGRHVSRLVMGVTSQLTAPRAAVMLDTFFERGGNAFDTAWEYEDGLAEQRLGWWIETRGVREEVVIIDKGAHTPDCYPEAVTRQHRESLDRLRTDHIDLYMLHRDNLEIPVGDFVEVLNEHRSAGTIKAFGASNWTLSRIVEAQCYAAQHDLEGFSAISNQFSLARMEVPLWEGSISSFDREWREWLELERMPLFAWSSQARGFFLDDDDGYIPADWGDRLPGEVDRHWGSAGNYARRERALELARRKGVAPITLALSFVLCQPFETFAVIGPRELAHLGASIEATAVDITPSEGKWLLDGDER